MPLTGGHVAGSGDHVGDHNLLDAAIVRVTTDQSIAGVKTFTDGIAVPDASLPVTAVNGLGSYVDSRIPDAPPMLEKFLFRTDPTTGWQLSRDGQFTSFAQWTPVVGAVYVCDAFLPYDSTDTADIKFRFTLTAGGLATYAGATFGEGGTTSVTPFMQSIVQLTPAQSMTASNSGGIYHGRAGGLLTLSTFTIEVSAIGSIATPLLSFQVAQVVGENPDGVPASTYQLRPGGALYVSRVA